MINFSIQQLRNQRDKSKEFFDLYKEFMINEKIELNEQQKSYLLSLAIIFLNQQDINLKKLGYRIIVRYTTIYKDYIPLYETSITLGFIPVTKLIEKIVIANNNPTFSMILTSAYMNLFKKDNIYLTEEQKELYDFTKKTISSALIVAPTSYGKSDLIIKLVSQNLDKKVCIVVPTKALLSQTQRRLLDNSTIYKSLNKIILHPEMYKDEDKFVAVLTQERLLTLLKKNKKLNLDLILIDEAHNIFNDTERDILLYKVMIIAKHRNPQTVFKFFSPFIANSNSLLSSNFKIDIESKKISEYIKIERFYLYDAIDKKRLEMYDQFLNEIIIIDDKNTYQNEID
ncbi:MAG: DEAD/DEAH box helicase, partial [Alphaproteobacteria bacterium]|nr:DEAD/DEAH box helicase [Alphaproteobacteria bacterium]